VNVEVHMNCLTKLTSDPNPTVHTLSTYRCCCWQGSTGRRHPATATSVGEALLSEGTGTYTSIHCQLGPHLFFPCTYPQFIASVQSSARTQGKSPQIVQLPEAE